MNGLVFDIQHFSIHDGPGIRTTVFMKGCSLDCAWCHNPESIKLHKEVQTYFYKCIGCGRCFEVCSQEAHRIVDSGRIYDRAICLSCGACTDNCYSGALVMTGKEMSVEEIIVKISGDIPFYMDSGGGVTFSGGEPLLQYEFVAEVLKELKKSDIHTAVDTAGNIQFKAFESVIPYTDMFLYDIKSISQDIHKEFTGAGNLKILSNLENLSLGDTSIRVRVPVIPGVNAHDDEIKLIADFLSDLSNIEAVEPLPYHSLGAGKLESMGNDAKRKIFSAPTQDNMLHIYELFEEKGLNVIRKPV